jgi:uncharacterized membrane protein
MHFRRPLFRLLPMIAFARAKRDDGGSFGSHAMIDLSILIICVCAALCGGVFFAFSTFVMRGLDRQGAMAAADAMRSINVTVFTPWFMVPLFGTAVAAAALAVLATIHGQASWPLQLGAATYVFGCVGVTMLGNVPLNNALMASRIDWPDYYRRWQPWNHVRTAACLLSALLLGYALMGPR